MKYLYCLIASLMFFCAPAYAATPANQPIQSQAEIYFEAGVMTSETITTTVEQMYGFTIEATSASGIGLPGVASYFNHYIQNLGNGSDSIIFSFVPTGETWAYELIHDFNCNGTHESSEITPESNPLLLGEDSKVCFFVSITPPIGAANGASREARLVATGEGRDGGPYTGVNGTIYGGPDTAEARDLVTVESNVNLKINREDTTGKIYISWSGGTADIYYIQGTFDATFANISKEAGPVSSPYYCSTEAKDTKHYYYKVQLSGRATYETQVLGKFDVPYSSGWNELSYPVVPSKKDPSTLVGRQVTGTKYASTADRIMKWNPNVIGSYEIAWLVGGSGTASDGKWFTGNAVTSMEVGSDEGFLLEIRQPHPGGWLTMAGEVSSTDRKVIINAGTNIVASCFPVTVTLEGSNLWQSGMTGAKSSAAADKVLRWNPTVIGSYEIAWLVDGVGPAYNGKWYSNNAPTNLKLVPGYAYRISIVPGHTAPFTWTYKKPY